MKETTRQKKWQAILQYNLSEVLTQFKFLFKQIKTTQIYAKIRVIGSLLPEL